MSPRFGDRPGLWRVLQVPEASAERRAPRRTPGPVPDAGTVHKARNRRHDHPPPGHKHLGGAHLPKTADRRALPGVLHAGHDRHPRPARARRTRPPPPARPRTPDTTATPVPAATPAPQHKRLRLDSQAPDPPFRRHVHEPREHGCEPPVDPPLLLELPLHRQHRAPRELYRLGQAIRNAPSHDR
jgi:hypothetical protein